LNKRKVQTNEKTDGKTKKSSEKQSKDEEKKLNTSGDWTLAGPKKKQTKSKHDVSDDTTATVKVEELPATFILDPVNDVAMSLATPVQVSDDCIQNFTAAGVERVVVTNASSLDINEDPMNEETAITEKTKAKKNKKKNKVAKEETTKVDAVTTSEDSTESRECLPAVEPEAELATQEVELSENGAEFNAVEGEFMRNDAEVELAAEAEMTINADDVVSSAQISKKKKKTKNKKSAAEQDSAGLGMAEAQVNPAEAGISSATKDVLDDGANLVEKTLQALAEAKAAEEFLREISAPPATRLDGRAAEAVPFQLPISEVSSRSEDNIVSNQSQPGIAFNELEDISAQDKLAKKKKKARKDM